MRLTLQFSGLEWISDGDKADRHELGHFAFDVTVAPDPSANSPMAERVNPPGVFKGCDFPVRK
jgi:hypothetical protein